MKKFREMFPRETRVLQMSCVRMLHGHNCVTLCKHFSGSFWKIIKKHGGDDQTEHCLIVTFNKYCFSNIR